ncbi:glycoside hydrolase family 16 protein [Sphingobacterium sp. lm-10]|uniref:glycoside hydrolase family 16 protein n=1 Tax=Sphingobacterium sp. lm-10 TaxID=2944904 RepID=UPI00202262AC|nr:glycoside hydrolase family 16 protein [Sphingobacterium sp. lm-10]MCL7987330.1 glycoside hydrolase family 16 protein [Sphingobacterium sp. lm-10]
MLNSLHPTWLLIATSFTLVSCGSGSKQDSAAKDSVDTVGYTFTSEPTWADEFDKDGLPDTNKWSYDVGSLHNGWGNQELQYYTDADSKNVAVKDGHLYIHALPEQKEGLDYTSARLVSKGKGDFLYGRFEVRAKVPEGKGTWPAVWMLPTDWKYGAWPNSGEIDILEHVGYDPDVVHISVHTKAYHHSIGTQKTAFRKIENARDDFHVYRVDWTPDYIKGFVDGQELFSFANERSGFKAWPFDQKFHWLINLAVGGFWGGAKGVDREAFPAAFVVDYVRVYDLVK